MSCQLEELPIIPNAQYNYDEKQVNPVPIGESVLFEFNPGYKVTSNCPKVTCELIEDVATWKVHTYCTPVSCGEPKYIPNARLIGGLFTFPNKISYKCEDRYKLQGLSNYWCGVSGEWQPSISVKCIQCPDLSPIENGTFMYVGGDALYECNKGSKLFGEEKRTCNVQGFWEGTKPTCVPKSCDQFSDFKNGSIDYVGNLAMFQCQPGFILMGSSTIKCQNGKWTASKPSCEKIKGCPDLKPLQNGSFRFLDSPENLNVLYECNEGYTLVGNEKRICSNSGIWTESEPLCKKTNFIYSFVAIIIIFFTKVWYVLSIVYSAIKNLGKS